MKTVEINFQNLPKTVEELLEIPEASLDTPFKAAAMTVLALCRYTENVEDGIKMLDFLNGPKEISNYDKQFLRDRLAGKEYLPYSYFKGTSPENNYTATAPYTVIISDNQYSYQDDGYAKLYINCTGADSPRPIVLRKKDNQWFMWEQFLLVGIRVPAKLSDW